jgi:hypothetical protein
MQLRLCLRSECFHKLDSNRQTFRGAKRLKVSEAMLNPNTTKIVMRSGSSFARGTTIDLYLDPKEIKTLYERWNQAAWGEIYSLPGGEQAITCEMVKPVSLFDLTSVYGHKLAKKLHAEAVAHAVID